MTDKKYMVEICGSFSAEGYYSAKSQEEAELMALSELHNLEVGLNFDFEQSDVEVTEQDK